MSKNEISEAEQAAIAEELKEYVNKFLEEKLPGMEISGILSLYYFHPEQSGIDYRSNVVIGKGFNVQSIIQVLLYSLRSAKDKEHQDVLLIILNKVIDNLKNGTTNISTNKFIYDCFASQQELLEEAIKQQKRMKHLN